MLLHINCGGSDFIDSSNTSSLNKESATILKILELTEYELLSTCIQYRHLNFYEGIYLIHALMALLDF